METTTYILNTTSDTPEPGEETYSDGEGLFGIVFVVFVFCFCSGLCKCFMDRSRELSCRDIASCNCDCESGVQRCLNKVSCVCGICGVCESGTRRCWGTITNAFGRRTETNDSTIDTNTEAPPTDTAPRLSSVIVDPVPSMTLPPSYESIVTDPSQPPPSYEEVMRWKNWFLKGTSAMFHSLGAIPKTIT